MERAGHLYKCDRCGATDFVDLELHDDSTPAIRVLLGRGWSTHDNNRELCPTCTVEYERLTSAFWEKPAVAVAEEVE